MSSHAAADIGRNAVICYFPSLPYYLRYQIGFDIILNPPVTQVNPSGAVQSQRVIHVDLYFPRGLICNPGEVGRMAHPASFIDDTRNLFPPHPYFGPSMYPHFPRVTPHVQNYAPMGFQAPVMWEHLSSYVVACVENGQPGDYMAIDGRLYDTTPQCRICGEFHREEDCIQYNPPTRVPKRKARTQAGPPRQHRPTTVRTDCRRSVVPARYKKHKRNEDHTKFTQQWGWKNQHASHGGVEGIIAKMYGLRIFCDKSTAAMIAEMSRYHRSEE